LICPLCLNFLYKCTTTVCGHSFCERCLDEYLILRKNCFLCDEVVRNKQLVSCFSIDNVIEQIISKVASSQEGTLVKERWDKQKKAHKDWVEGRKIENIEVGDKVDIRDTEYIWCEGKVKIKIECPNRDTLLVVHYEGWNKYYDEIIKQNSPRIAPHGLFTSRKDIPKYHLKSDNSMVGVIVNRTMPTIPPPN